MSAINLAPSGSYQIDAQTITESTTTRILSLGDRGAYIRCTHASGCAITVPPAASVPFPANSEICFRVAAASPVSLVPGDGVTINNASAVASLPQHSTFVLKQIATNTWDLIGS